MNKDKDTKALIAVMAKYPRGGQVKTRLVPPLTLESAAGLYEAVLKDTINIVDKTCFQKTVFFDPPDKKAYFDDITGQDWLVIPQSGKDLGQRLKNAFLKIIDYKHPAVIIGSDSPALPMERILEAVTLLDADNDIVLGPAEDGGFYLIGIKDIKSVPLEKIFRYIRWSTSYAMEDIRMNIKDAGVKLAFTGSWFDLDDGEDYKKMVSCFNTHNQDSYRNTRAYISYEKRAKNMDDILKDSFNNLTREKISHVSLNIGILCNQECRHCHLEAGPGKSSEVMPREMIGKLKEYIKNAKPYSLEITGGAPELNYNIIELISQTRPLVEKMTMRTNLTAMSLCSFTGFPDFLYENKVALVASLPCHSKEKVDAQRGNGVFEKSIRELGRLNSIGFGVDGGVPVTLVYNPTDYSLPPDQIEVEKDFKKRLSESYGIEFTDLVTMTNVPVGRFAGDLKKKGSYREYMRELQERFNNETLSRLMCINQVTIDWRGRFYDCDFNLALDLPRGGWSDLDTFRDKTGIGNSTFTGYHCLACTAGSGSSCHGSLTRK